MAAVCCSVRRGLGRGQGEAGQSLVLVVLSLAVLLGMAALAIDVGDWWWTKRKEQAVVDAAALAGAQALPEDPAAARDIATTYAGENGVTLTPGEITFSRSNVDSDTIGVAIERNESSFFGGVFGVGSVQVGAHASARVNSASSALWVAPIAVASTHPMLQCNPPPCSGGTSLTLLDLHNPGSGNASGSFSLLDLIQGDTGNQGQGTVAGWMQTGYDQEMPLGSYFAEPSTFYNGNAFQNALQARVGDEVLFPVYLPPIIGSGSTAQYNIIAWVGFHIDAATATGNGGTLTGHFTRYIAQGIPATSWNPNYYGTRIIQLTQ